ASCADAHTSASLLRRAMDELVHRLNGVQDLCGDFPTQPSDACEPLSHRQEPSIPLDHQTPIHNSGLRGEAAIHEEHEGLRVTAACDIGRSRPTRFHLHLVCCHEHSVLAPHCPRHRKVTAPGHPHPCGL